MGKTLINTEIPRNKINVNNRLTGNITSDVRILNTVSHKDVRKIRLGVKIIIKLYLKR